MQPSSNDNEEQHPPQDLGYGDEHTPPAGGATPQRDESPAGRPERPLSCTGDRFSRPRVRFNSSAAQKAVSDDTKAIRSATTSPSPSRMPRPALSRNPSSYNSVIDGGPDIALSPAKAKSAEDAARRAQEAAVAARHSSDDTEKQHDEENDPWLSQSEGNGHETPRSTEEQEAQYRSTSERAAFLLGAHKYTPGPQDNGNTYSPSEADSTAGFESHTPKQPKGGVFYQILQSYRNPMYDPNFNGSTSTKIGTAESSGATTPTRRKWYSQDKANRSQETLSMLVGASRKLANPTEKAGELPSPHTLRKRPGHKRTTSGRILSAADAANQDEIRIQMQIANLLQRQKYIVKMCRALMSFGAPGHRLEEHLQVTANWLEIPSQFLYVPDCMIVSFDDHLTHTTKVNIVREAQGVNLSKLKDTHEIYKEVLHDTITLDEAVDRLEKLLKAPVRWPVWVRVIMYGLASASISTFFNARFVDMPIILVLGTLLGFGQVVLVPKSRTFAVVFEVLAATLLAFAARGFGSINGGSTFCYSALTQSSIAMILPGVLVLNSALELQSKAIVPGSIRMVFAIIYSLFLGYGITVGTTLYGYVDSNATTNPDCQNPADKRWGFLLVPLFIWFATFTSNAKWKQMPLMVVIGTVGYVVNYFSATKFAASLPIAYALGAFAVGVLANAYSRFMHGVAITVLLPAVFVQVPGSLATSGAITAGLQTATALQSPNANNTQDTQMNTVVFSLAASMIQISIGISVGLSMANVLMYPLGKQRSALWSL